MNKAPPAPEKPSPEALAAARQAFLDTGDRLATLEGGQRMRFLTVEEVALALARFAVPLVEAERERCAAIVGRHANHSSQGQNCAVFILEAIRSGEQP